MNPALGLCRLLPSSIYRSASAFATVIRIADVVPGDRIARAACRQRDRQRQQTQPIVRLGCVLPTRGDQRQVHRPVEADAFLSSNDHSAACASAEGVWQPTIAGAS